MHSVCKKDRQEVQTFGSTKLCYIKVHILFLDIIVDRWALFPAKIQLKTDDYFSGFLSANSAVTSVLCFIVINYKKKQLQKRLVYLVLTIFLFINNAMLIFKKLHN